MNVLFSTYGDRWINMYQIHGRAATHQSDVLSLPVWFLPGVCQEECLFNEVCVVEQLTARCSCDPIECDGTYRPVCGKDGRTYSNDCARRKEECLNKALIPIKHQGPCGEWNYRNEKEWKHFLLCPSKIVVVFLQSPCRFLSLLQRNVFFLLLFFYILLFPGCRYVCSWLEMYLKQLSDAPWMGVCRRVGGLVSKACLHFSTRSPPIHLLIPVMPHPVTKRHPHVSFIHSLFSPGLCCFPVLCLFLFVLCVAVFLYKEKLFFLLAALQSVCLSVFVRLATFLAVWLQVEKWGHPVGSLTGWIPDGWSSFPSRQDDLGGVGECCLYPLAPSVSVCVLVPSMCPSCFPSSKVLMCEVGEVFLFPCSLYFDSC